MFPLISVLTLFLVVSKRGKKNLKKSLNCSFLLLLFCFGVGGVLRTETLIQTDQKQKTLLENRNQTGVQS